MRPRLPLAGTWAFQTTSVRLPPLLSGTRHAGHLDRVRPYPQTPQTISVSPIEWGPFSSQTSPLLGFFMPSLSRTGSSVLLGSPRLATAPASTHYPQRPAPAGVEKTSANTAADTHPLTQTDALVIAYVGSPSPILKLHLKSSCI